MEIITLALHMFLALGGLVGGFQLIKKPDGSGLGMTNTLLKRSPVNNFFWPGIFLIIVMCLWPAVNIIGIASNQSWVSYSIFTLGIICIGWIFYQCWIIRTFSWFQPLVSLIGAYFIVYALIFAN